MNGSLVAACGTGLFLLGSLVSSKSDLSFETEILGPEA